MMILTVGVDATGITVACGIKPEIQMQDRCCATGNSPMGNP
jgi:hypothetical protein